MPIRTMPKKRLKKFAESLRGIRIVRLTKQSLSYLIKGKNDCRVPPSAGLAMTSRKIYCALSVYILLNYKTLHPKLHIADSRINSFTNDSFRC